MDIRNTGNFEMEQERNGNNDNDDNIIQEKGLRKGVDRIIEIKNGMGLNQIGLEVEKFYQKCDCMMMPFI